MAVNNATIMDAILLEASNDYYNRVPQASVDGIQAAQNAVLGNNRLFNEFVHNMAVLIGSQKANILRYSNPLSIFKSDAFKDGKIHMEYGTGFVDPMQYDPLATHRVLGNYELDVETAFYAVNRKVLYPVTVNPKQVRSAFNNVESGLNDYISMMVNAPWISNEYDEYRFMLQTLAVANASHPFYNVQSTISDINNPTADEAKGLSRKIRTYAEKLGLQPSPLYNGMALPTLTPKENLVVITIPEVKAALDVEVLADAFHIDKTDIAQRIVTVDEFPWAGVWAILADKELLLAGDFIQEIDGFYNPASLTQNYFLHAQGGYGVNAFKNAIVFSNTASTQVGVVEVELDSISAWVELNDGTISTEVLPNSLNHFKVSTTGTIDPANDNVLVPSTYTVKILNGTQEVSPRTFVNSAGHLVIGSDVAAGTTLTIQVTAAYRNPSAALGTPTTPITASVTVDVVSEYTVVPPVDPEDI